MLFILFWVTANFAAAATPCAPFKVHQSAKLPPAFIDVTTQTNESETNLVKKIGEINTQQTFPAIYQSWLAQHANEHNKQQRNNWLQCLHHYVSIDSDQDGIPDWSAVSDRLPAKVLYPQDADQDGDGILNVLDAEPLAVSKNNLPTGTIPTHLKFDQTKRPEAAKLQEQLYKDYGLLAIDHTDMHSAAVLREFLFLLQRSFSRDFILGLKSLKYVYAFSGHDRAKNIAAYYYEARAISVGGVSSYPETENDLNLKVNLLSAMAHEMGHAVLFDKLKAQNLADAASKFSGWSRINTDELNNDLFSPVFFMSDRNRKEPNIVSEYALVNRHEWFAESFAADLLNELGEAGNLSNEWRRLLTKKSSGSLHYWIDYVNINDEFRSWLKNLRFFK